MDQNVPISKEVFDQIVEQETSRLASVASLILLTIGAVLTTTGAIVLYGVGAGFVVLGLMLFVIGVLIGRE